MLYYCESCEAVLGDCDVSTMGERICPAHDHEVLGLPTRMGGQPDWRQFRWTHDESFTTKVKQTWRDQGELPVSPRSDMPRKEDL